MLNKTIPAEYRQRKASKSSRSPHQDGSASSTNDCTANSNSNTDAGKPTARSQPDSASLGARQNPRDRTFSFRDSFGHEDRTFDDDPAGADDDPFLHDETRAPAGKATGAVASATERGDQRSTQDGGPKSKRESRSPAKQGASTSKRSLLPRQADPYPVGTPDATFEHVVPDGQGGEVPAVANIARGGDIESVPELMKVLRDDKGPWVPRYLREITGSGDQAIILAQILYWFDLGKKKKVRATRRRQGELWAYNTHRDLAKEVGMKPRRVTRVLQILQGKGFIEARLFKVNGQPTSHYRPILQAVLRAIVRAEQCRE